MSPYLDFTTTFTKEYNLILVSRNLYKHLQTYIYVCMVVKIDITHMIFSAYKYGILVYIVVVPL